MALAIRQAVGSGWVHETVSANDSGHSLSMVNDVGTNEGRQVIVSDGAHGRVLVLNGDAYLYGDEAAIKNYFEISKSDPQKYANQWIELKPSDPGFSTVSGAVTLTSDFEQVSMTGTLTMGNVVSINGHKVRPINGHVPATAQSPAGTATLYVTTSGKVLPFEYRVVAKGTRFTTRWNDWGRPAELTAPSPTFVSS